MRRIDPRLPERIERLDLWWTRTDKIMTIIGLAAIAAAPIWLIIKSL